MILIHGICYAAASYTKLNKLFLHLKNQYENCWICKRYVRVCLNNGTHKTINFPFGTNGKSMVSGVEIL